jgi:GGDEF domain-containing protein
MRLAASFIGIDIALPLTALAATLLGVGAALSLRKDGDRAEDERRSLVSHLQHQVDKGRQIGLHDPSTLLLQPWYFDLRLAEEISRCQRYGTRMAVLRVLVAAAPGLDESWIGGFADELGQNLHRAVRATDLVSRLSEREFVACLPQTGEAGARATAGRVASLSPTLPLSIGWALCPDDGADLQGLLNQAGIPANEKIAETPALPEAAPSNSYAHILAKVRCEDRGQFAPQEGETLRALKLRLRKASREAGCGLKVWEADGFVFFERTHPVERSAA